MRSFHDKKRVCTTLSPTAEYLQEGELRGSPYLPSVLTASKFLQTVREDKTWFAREIALIVEQIEMLPSFSQLKTEKVTYLPSPFEKTPGVIVLLQGDKAYMEGGEEKARTGVFFLLRKRKCRGLFFSLSSNSKRKSPIKGLLLLKLLPKPIGHFLFLKEDLPRLFVCLMSLFLGTRQER